eukprot:61054_1
MNLQIMIQHQFMLHLLKLQLICLRKKHEYEKYESQLQNIKQQALQQQESIMIEEKLLVHQMKRTALTETNKSRMELQYQSASSNISNTTNTTMDTTTSSTNNSTRESLPYIEDHINTMEYQDFHPWYQRRNIQTLIIAGVAFGICSYLLYKYTTTPTTGTRRKPRYSLKYRF